MAWKGESRRHSLARKGIKTKTQGIPSRKMGSTTLYNTPLGEYGDSSIKWKGKKFKQVLTDDDMLDFCTDNHLHNWAGKLGFNDCKEISGQSPIWILQEVSLSKFDWIVDPEERPKHSTSPLIPPIVVKYSDGDIEVLDGKHRIGEEKYKEQSTIMVYVGYPDWW